MPASVYYYLNHEPEARLEAEALDGEGSAPWLIVRGAGKDAPYFTLGLTAEQARDFARALFKGAGEVDALQAEADAKPGEGPAA